MSIYDSTLPYPRDLIGYGRDVPHAQWPGGARVAVQFVLNYEEGGENCVLHGDQASEQFLSEMFNPAAFEARHISMEGIYEYGSRAGVWRLLREFEKRGLPLTVFGVATALQKHSDVTAAFQELGYDIACHGLKWIHYQNIDEATERAHMAEAMEIIRKLTGERPLGWYTGRDSPQTHRLAKFRGQRQKWFALRFTGNESEIDPLTPRNGQPTEFDAWRWERLDHVADLVVPFRRDVYLAVAEQFARFGSVQP